MSNAKKVEEITDLLCTTYGTDTGIVFGISSRQSIEAIVNFTILNIGLKELKDSTEWLLSVISKDEDEYPDMQSYNQMMEAAKEVQEAIKNITS